MSACSKKMRIAIIGGGKRCRSLLEMLSIGRLSSFDMEVAAVADPDSAAVGIQLARQLGIPTVADYRELRHIPGVDGIVELTGTLHLLEALRRDDPPVVLHFETALSGLLRDVIRIHGESLFEKRQLHLNEGILESIFSSMRDEVFVIRPDHRIVDVNEAFLQAVGTTKEEVVGRHCYAITHHLDGPCEGTGEFCPLQESLATGAAAHTIHEHYDGSGKAFYHEITTVPLKNERGEVELILEIMRDITDELEKRVEQKTRALKMNLARLIHEDKMIALGKLVASAVHEINNPLSGILALARLMHRKMAERRLSDEEREQFSYYLQLIDQEAARCSGIVSNLLSFSRQRKPKYELFPLNELIRRVVLLFNHRMQLNRVALKLDLAEPLPLMRGDPGQIQQCLINLLFNAMEAMPDGGAVTVRTFVDQQEFIVLEVEDTGVGISEEMMTHIFEPFFSTKLQDKGVGLGLSVVYGIVKDHLGSIYVRSEVGEGSTFSIRFPGEETP